MNEKERATAYNKRLREIREEHDIPQRAVAAYLHVVQRTYSDYESGRIRIPLDCMILLAKYYDVSMDYLSGLTTEKGHFPG